MTALVFNNIIGLNQPYTVYVCDVFGNQCILLAYIATTVPAI